MDASQAYTETVTRRDYVLGVVVSSGFRMKDDGYLYPKTDEPLVRVLVGGSSYELQRRARVGTAWMPISSMGLDEFDQASFENWASIWPLAG